MVQKLVRRQCKSQKMCSSCEREIAIGEWYWGNPNLSLCDECKVAQDSGELKSKNTKDNGYTVSKKSNCTVCGEDAGGNYVQGEPFCLLHIREPLDKAVEETV